MSLKSTGWTPEKRARASALTKKQKPWLTTTGPKTQRGKDTAKMNALKHGLRSEDYRELLKLLRVQAEFVKSMNRDKLPS